MSADDQRDNLRGGAWLIADLSLNIWSLSIVKWLGAEYAPAQTVFFRAIVGFALILPLIWMQRGAFRRIPDPGLHALRVGLSIVTLLASFYALARIPLALFTSVGFTRPIITMLMAAALLGERIGPRRWLAVALALTGALIAAAPASAEWSGGLAAMLVVVVGGSGAIIATRRLRDAPPVVLMTFYTAGLAAATLPLALWSWTPPPAQHLGPLLAIGALAQAAQVCFLRAHYLGDAGFLSILAYLSLIFSVTVGYVVFGETITLTFVIGASLVLGAAVWTTLLERAGRRG